MAATWSRSARRSDCWQVWGSDYAPRVDRAKRTKRILFVEGRSDVPILKILADKLGMAWPTEWTEWTTTYSQKERKQLYLALKEEVPDLIVLSLRDRDDEPAETVKEDLVDPSAAGDAGYFPRRWRRRYIESYLIWPAAIAAAAGVPEADVVNELRDRHGIACRPELHRQRPAPSPPRRAREADPQARGGTAVLGQFDVSPHEVALHMDPAAICTDIKTFLADVKSLV